MNLDAANSSRERLESILARLAARSDERVFATLYPEAARAAADASDRRRIRGRALGPLEGKIVSIKDLFDVAGEPTTAGSVILRGAAPASADAEAVRRLRAAGAVILGKTAMTEFAFLAVGINMHSGTPGNAVDAARIPGGSSSGAGVSVAEGTSEIAIGSDTGGSVRIPASLNGVVGFKPTAGRIPSRGAYPLSYTLDSIGPLARTVAECAAADAALAGDDAAPGQAAFARLRVGVPRGRLFEGVEDAVAEAFERSLRVLERAGAKVFDHAIDDLLAAIADASATGSIASVEGAAVHADWLVEGAANVDPRVAGPLGRRLAFPAHRYIRLLRRREELERAMRERLSDVDVLALPTTPMTAPLTQPLADDPKLYNHVEGLLLRNTQVANQFGLTAISLPMPRMNLPAGLMLMARGGCDRLLLGIGAAVETALQAGP